MHVVVGLSMNVVITAATLSSNYMDKNRGLGIGLQRSSIATARMLELEATILFLVFVFVVIFILLLLFLFLKAYSEFLSIWVFSPCWPMHFCGFNTKIYGQQKYPNCYICIFLVHVGMFFKINDRYTNKTPAFKCKDHNLLLLGVKIISFVMWIRAKGLWWEVTGSDGRQHEETGSHMKQQKTTKSDKKRQEGSDKKRQEATVSDRKSQEVPGSHISDREVQGK
jgi:hypothetical protein